MTRKYIPKRAAFFFSRIDYQDYALRNKTKEMEIVWRGSYSLGQETEIFTSVMYGTYLRSIPSEDISLFLFLGIFCKKKH